MNREFTVKGKQREYLIKVEARDDRLDKSAVLIDTPWQVEAFDAATGALVRKQTLMMKTTDRRADLDGFINSFKHSAENDFR